MKTDRRPAGIRFYGTKKKLVLYLTLLTSHSSAQGILDSCFTSAAPSPTFISSATLIDSYDADLLEWTGAAWNGAWTGANIITPPPCNNPPVRAIWVGDSAVWTTGGEAFGLKFSPPLITGSTYHFFFTYVSAGLGSSGAFAPNVFTNNSGVNGGNYVGDFIPAGTAWETHPFSFTATPAQAGDEFLIIRSNNGSGMVLNLCAETLTDLGNDSLILCVGDSIILFAGNGFQSYSWNTGQTTSQITVNSPGTYISTNQGFCGTSSDTVVITLDPCGQFPVAVFSTPDNHICPGTCTDFTNLSQNASSYLWNFTGASPASSTDINPSGICYTAPGTYPVQLIASNALTSDTLVLNNFITVFPFPAPQGILQSGDTLFANPGALSYQWYHGGNAIPGATNYFYVAGEVGDYNVVATDINGCEVEAAIFDVIASAGFFPAEKSFKLFPNPVTHELTVVISAMNNNHAEVNIINVLGETVYQCRIANPGQIIKRDISHLPAGIYLFLLSADLKVFRSPFVKE